MYKDVIYLELRLTSPKDFFYTLYLKFKNFSLTILLHDEKIKNTKMYSNYERKEKEIISLVGYAEYITKHFKWQNEIQSKHLYNFQTTMVVNVMYWVNEDYDPSDKNNK